MCWGGGLAQSYPGQQKVMVFISAGLEGEVHPRKLHKDLHRELLGGGLCQHRQTDGDITELKLHQTSGFHMSLDWSYFKSKKSDHVWVCVAALSRCVLVPSVHTKGLR